MSNEQQEKKEKGMLEKLKGFFKKENDSKEIDELINKLILGELDDLNYGLEKNLGLKKEDVEALKEANNIRLENKRAFWELVKTVAQILGITVGVAATLVSMIYTVKGHDFDVEWMNKIFEMKDSLNVIDPNSRNQISKNHGNHRKMVENLGRR